MRLLSVIIPSYNTELYIERCLDSLLYDEEIIDKLDIIIVNDGSSDKTPKIAKKYQESFPKTITVINKENGGHGSTVNAGLKIAKGKYLKIIDSDDWVNVFDFSDFVKRLEEVDDDLVITDYVQSVLYDGIEDRVSFFHGDDSSKPIDQIRDISCPNGVDFALSIHAITVKTEKLKEVWGEGLLEHTFYVDMQFAAKVLECTKTFRTLDYTIYVYFIGRPDQSVADFFRRRSDHERVLRWIVTELDSGEVQESEFLTFMLKLMLKSMINTHYEAYYQTLEATRDQLQEIFDFDVFLMARCPDLHSGLSAAYGLRRRLSPMRRFLKRKWLTM